MLVSGGGAGAEVYDPITGSWTPTGPMVIDRFFHTATLLNSGEVLVAGGEIPVPGGTGFAETAELYDPSTSTWRLTSSMNFVRAQHQAVQLADGTVLVVGSSFSAGYANAELYDPGSASWTVTPALNVGRPADHTATLLNSGQVLVAGGVVLDATSAELYTSATTSAAVGLAPTGLQETATWRIAAYYDRTRQLLHVEVMGVSRPATLTVTVEEKGQVVGVLAPTGGHTYQCTFAWPVIPGSIVVQSSREGSVVAKVTLK